MPRKYTILSTVTALLASTLASLAPTVTAVQYDGLYGEGEYYTVAEVLPLRNQYVEEVKRTCGEYATISTFQQCVMGVTNSYRSTYGKLGSAALKLDQGSSAAFVTGLNPTAETLRFFVSDTNAFASAVDAYQDLYIFWLDGDSGFRSITGNTDAIKALHESLRSGQTPDGLHLLYGSQQGAPDWFAYGAENRVEYSTTGDFVADSIEQKVIFLGSYASGEVRYQVSSFANCLEGGYTLGQECRAGYYFSPSNTYTFYYAGADAATEDQALVKVKLLEQAVREAEEAAREAADRARKAEERASQAAAAAAAAEAAARDTESRASELEEAIEAAERATAEAKRVAAEAKSEADAAASRASAAEQDAASARAEADAAKSAAAAAESRANAAEEAARAAAAAAESAGGLLDEITSAAERAKSATMQAAEEATRAGALADSARATLEAALAAESAARSALESSLITPQGSLAAGQDTGNLLAEIAAIRATLAGLAADSGEQTTAPIGSTDCANGEAAAAVVVPDAGDSDGSRFEFPYWILAPLTAALAIFIWFFLPKRREQEKSDQN